MAYEFKTNIANKGNYGSKRELSSIKYIVIHYTANDGDTDENNGKYFKNNVVQVSAHYFVDDDSVTQSVPDDYVAYAVGGNKYSDCAKTGGGKLHGIATNKNTLSIEICDDIRNGVVYPSAKTIENVVELTKKKMKEYNIPKENVIRHFDISGKRCPDYWCGTPEKDSKWKTEFWNKLSTSTASTTTSNATTTPSSTTTSLKFKENDIVSFAGGKQYVSSNAVSGSEVKASRAKITAVAKSGKHPYHIRAVDNQGVFVNGVYGWVDVSTVSTIEVETVTKPTTTTTNTVETKPATTIETGAKLTLKNVILYASSSATTKAGARTGDFYVWSKDVINNRIRITNNKSNVGKSNQVTGWISYADAQKSISTTTTTSTKTKTLEDWAREVIDGKHGNGAIKRMASLKKAGCPYSYVKVQAKVNKLL